VICSIVNTVRNTGSDFSETVMGLNPKSSRCQTRPRAAAPLVLAKCGLRGICSRLKFTILCLSLMVLVAPAFGGLISADFAPQLQLPDCSEAKQRSASLNRLVHVLRFCLFLFSIF